MDRFNTFVNIVLNNEGGYVNNPNDPGGETKYGISKKSYPNLDIANLTKNKARQIYKNAYWNELYDDIKDSTLAFKLFDLSVNCGKSTAVKKLQLAANEVCDEKIKADGIFGPRTLEAINKSSEIITVYICIMRDYYEGLIAKNSALHVFKKGWFKRLRKLPRFEEV